MMSNSEIGPTICLLPVGAVGKQLLGWIARDVSAALPVQCTVASALPEPDYALEPGSGQYDSTPILKEILRCAPLDALRVVGITEADLFMHVLSYVFGRAQLGGRAAVVSLARLRPEFHKEAPDPDLTAVRAVKEVVHELGHTFGLVHCQDPECVMYLANVIRQIDRKSQDLCGQCRASLEEALRSSTG
jgi:archaemetzincin